MANFCFSLTGDVLVYVNDTCVLGFTHHDMVSMFQSIATGDLVSLEVCRGYPLPFDPDDPDTEIVTTVAVTSPGQNDWASELERQRMAQGQGQGQGQPDAHSMPDLTGQPKPGARGGGRPGSADLLSADDGGGGYGDENGEVRAALAAKNNPDSLMTIPITKGGMGFGFTIADSAFGQKVKKILDRSRCKNLQEGDVLVSINEVDVRGMGHGEVVKVLKECARGKEAAISIQRGLIPSGGSGGSPSKAGKFKKDGLGLRPKSGFLFRSKTPTADLYSTQVRRQTLRKRNQIPSLLKHVTFLINNFFSRLTIGEGEGSEPSQDAPGRHSQLASRRRSLKDANVPAPERQRRSAERRTGALPAQRLHTGQPRRGRRRRRRRRRVRQLSGLQPRLQPVRADGRPQPEPAGRPDLLQSAPDAAAAGVSGRISAGPGTDLQRVRGLPEYRLQPAAAGGWADALAGKDVPAAAAAAAAAARGRVRRLQRLSRGRVPVRGSRAGLRLQRRGEAAAGLLSGPDWTGKGKNNDTPKFDAMQFELIKPSLQILLQARGGAGSASGSLSRSVGGGGGHHSHRKESTSFEHSEPLPGNLTRWPNTSRRAPSVNPDCVELTVTLHRHDSGFGFRIVGGTEEGSQVSIGHIVPGGAADLDGRLFSGDEIVAVDGSHVINTSHHQVGTFYRRTGCPNRHCYLVHESSEDVPGCPSLILCA